MSTYKMDDGKVVNTALATASWSEDTLFDGNNHISKATGSQWNHERLYRSRKGNYYIEWWSEWQGSTPRAEWISRQGAARWLLHNNQTLPDDLADLETEVTE